MLSFSHELILLGHPTQLLQSKLQYQYLVGVLSLSERFL